MPPSQIVTVLGLQANLEGTFLHVGSGFTVLNDLQMHKTRIALRGFSLHCWEQSLSISWITLLLDSNARSVVVGCTPQSL